MKDQIRFLLSGVTAGAGPALIVREYLQARILEALQRGGAFQDWAFLGGTALRFLYQLPRFSEDLDFSLTTAVPQGPALQSAFNRHIGNVRRILEAEAYIIQVRAHPERVVQSAFIDFPGLPHELGLSPHPSQRLSIKVEMDTNPPAHAIFERSLVRRHVFLNLQHYDKASLLAGKLHALLSRPHTKGRDLYDLMWYLSDPSWPGPNLALLQASLDQTGTGQASDAREWPALVGTKLRGMDWPKALADLRPFIENPHEIELLTRDNLLRLLERR